MNWSIYHGRESQKHTKNDQILSFHKSLASFFIKKTYPGPSFGSHYSENPISLLPIELVQTLTATRLLIHRMHAKGFPPSGLMNYLQSN